MGQDMMIVVATSLLYLLKIIIDFFKCLNKSLTSLKLFDKNNCKHLWYNYHIPAVA